MPKPIPFEGKSHDEPTPDAETGLAIPAGFRRIGILSVNREVEPYPAKTVAACYLALAIVILLASVSSGWEYDPIFMFFLAGISLLDTLVFSKGRTMLDRSGLHMNLEDGTEVDIPYDAAATPHDGSTCKKGIRMVISAQEGEQLMVLRQPPGLSPLWEVWLAEAGDTAQAVALLQAHVKHFF